MKNFSFPKMAICAVMIIFLFFQVYSSVYKPITTETVSFYEASDGININAVMIREEIIVESNTAGTLHFVTKNGKRVSKDGLIANVYENESASITVSKIENLEKQIADINQLQGYNDLEAASLELINGKIDEYLNNVIRSSSGGNFGKSIDYKSDLLASMNRKQLITGEINDFSAQLNDLNSQLANLKSSLPASKGIVNAPVSGYFVSSLDGFEDIYKTDDLKKITPDFINNSAAKAADSKEVGKIVSDYEWYIAAEVTLNESLKFKVGDKATLKTSIKSCPELDVTVKQINISNAGNNAALIFSCQQMNSDLALVRKANMTAVKNSYTGLKIDKKALRVVDSKTGVYVVTGMQLKFVPITITFSTDEYVICEQEKTDKNVLRLYDEVVVKGKKLYDGKVIG